MQQQEKNKPHPIKDVSRFTRWVNHMDEKERNLSTKARKSKWIATLIILLSLFILSFFLFPGTRVKHNTLSEEQQAPAVLPEKQKPEPFDMPVDSFETRLKQQFDEKYPEKK